MKKQKSGSAAPDLRGLSQLNQDTYAIRVQLRKPSGQMACLKRTLRGTTLARAIEARDALREVIRTGEPVPMWIDELANVTPTVSPNPPPTEAPPSTTRTDLPALGDFVEQWLERKKARGDLEVSTAERYATALDHLSPRLQRTRLDEMTPEMIEHWMLAAREDFQPSTINGWLRVLRAALNRSGPRGQPGRPGGAPQGAPQPGGAERASAEGAPSSPRSTHGDRPDARGRGLDAGPHGSALGRGQRAKWSDVDEREGVL